MKKTGWLVVLVALLMGVTLIVQRTRRIAAAPRSSAAITDAPSFTAKDLHDADVSLAQYKGKVVLVNFWATWCGPCRIEIPWMIEFQNKYGPRGFTVLGVAMDDDGKKDVEPFIRDERFSVAGQKVSVNYPIVIGNDALGDRFGGLIGLPTSVLISRDGKKIKTFIGLVDYDKLSKEIEGQL